jgi:methylmalonyl-CoA mutase N-terminal domain/subunit
MKIITDIVSYCTENVPRWNSISISGYHIREAGSTAVQELAFTIGDGIAYVQACVDAGQNVDDFAPRLSYFFNSHNDLFEEVAKFRAARRMWARIMKERFGAKKPVSMLCRFHTQTAGCSLTAQQPYNNVVRTTIQALAAVLGGTQSLHTNSLDETLALPTEESVTIALRTQQIIAKESGVPNVIDPLGGSYYVEAMTDKMEQAAWDYINRIDEMGGMLKAIESGYPQKEISRAAYLYQKQTDSGEKVVVGINEYVTDKTKPIPTLYISEQTEKDQVARLGQIRSERNNPEVEKTLATLEQTARDGGNVMPPILECVRAYASEGEIVNAMKKVFGQYKDPAYL